MGAIVSAACRCGYGDQFMLGGGMASFETLCLFPVYCRACGTLELANLFDKPLRCGRCGGRDVSTYDSAELQGEAGEREVFSWNMHKELGRTLRLTDGAYLCPSCHHKQLRFNCVGNWD